MKHPHRSFAVIPVSYECSTRTHRKHAQICMGHVRTRQKEEVRYSPDTIKTPLLESGTGDGRADEEVVVAVVLKKKLVSCGGEENNVPRVSLVLNTPFPF